ncbi:hypothetical protein Fot_50731 [Forsythia ovata]|uniref:Uncharacterized protein n=1 Tax=Forsythia ovata TaxID=205694 RepID=A0ABD1PZ01_9LAMI
MNNSLLNFVKGKVLKAKLPTCVRGPLTRQIVNRGMYKSSRDLRERANRPIFRIDSHNISVKICPTWESNVRCQMISSHVTSGLTNSPMPLGAFTTILLLLRFYYLLN